MLNFPAALEQVLGKPAPTLDFERGRGAAFVDTSPRRPAFSILVRA